MVDGMFWWRKILGLFSTRYADLAVLHRILALRMKGAHRECYVALHDLLTRHPEWRNGDAYLMCASYEISLDNDMSRAGELLDTALRLGCKDMASYYAMSGYVLWETGERERGIREMETAVGLEPRIGALTVLGIALYNEENARAEAIWEQVLAKDPENCKAYTFLGVLAAKSGDRERFLQMAKKAEELCRNAGHLAEVAMMYAEAGEIQTALDKHQEAERRGRIPDGPVCADIAACYFKLGNIREGCRQLENARRCFPNSIRVKEAWDTYKDKCRDSGE